MEHDQMYFVIDNQVITLDEMGTPVTCELNNDGTPDWESFDLIDWMDLLPDQYQLFKAAVDFLQKYSIPMYVK